MLSVLFSVLATQAVGLSESYVGLYADRNDRAFVITSGTSMEYIDNDLWGSINGIYQAPNRDFVGTWAQSRSLNTSKSGYRMNVLTPGRAERGWVALQEVVYDNYRAHPLMVFNADNVRYAGEIRMKFLTNSTMTLDLKDSKGINFLNTSLTYLGEYGRIRVGGVYKDKYTQLNITEVMGQTKWTAEGTFTHLGTKYNVSGERLFTRGVLNIIDVTNGRFVGMCIYGYSPSRSQMKAFRTGSIEPADAILVNFVAPGDARVQVKGLSR